VEFRLVSVTEEVRYLFTIPSLFVQDTAHTIHTGPDHRFLLSYTRAAFSAPHKLTWHYRLSNGSQPTVAVFPRQSQFIIYLFPYLRSFESFIVQHSGSQPPQIRRLLPNHTMLLAPLFPNRCAGWKGELRPSATSYNFRQPFTGEARWAVQ